MFSSANKQLCGKDFASRAFSKQIKSNGMLLVGSCGKESAGKSIQYCFKGKGNSLQKLARRESLLEAIQKDNCSLFEVSYLFVKVFVHGLLFLRGKQ